MPCASHAVPANDPEVQTDKISLCLLQKGGFCGVHTVKDKGIPAGWPPQAWPTWPPAPDMHFTLEKSSDPVRHSWEDRLGQTNSSGRALNFVPWNTWIHSLYPNKSVPVEYFTEAGVCMLWFCYCSLYYGLFIVMQDITSLYTFSVA